MSNISWLWALLPFCLASAVLAAPNLGRLGTVLSPGDTGGLLIPWESRTMISNVIFPCNREGFHIHPTNCSRFYRCVDFSNGSDIFSRFQFECSQAHIFVPGIDTCVPGDCSKGQVVIVDPVPAPYPVDEIPSVPTVPDVPQSPPLFPDEWIVDGGPGGESNNRPLMTEPLIEQAPVEEVPVEEAPVEEAAVEEVPVEEVAPVEEVPVEEAPVEEVPVEEVPVEEVAPVEEVPVEEVPVEEVPVEEAPVEEVPVEEVPVEEAPVEEVAAEVAPSEMACTGKYEQHVIYCNVFHLCNDESRIFTCAQGTAFCNVHQMCRLSAIDETLCEGKSVFTGSRANFRNLGNNWKKIGIIELTEPPVRNAQIFGFTDISAVSKSELKAVGYYDAQRTASSPPREVQQSPQIRKPASFDDENSENYFQYLQPSNFPAVAPQKPFFPTYVYRKPSAPPRNFMAFAPGFNSEQLSPFDNLRLRYDYGRPTPSFNFREGFPIFNPAPMDDFQDFASGFGAHLIIPNSYLEPSRDPFDFRETFQNPTSSPYHATFRLKPQSTPTRPTFSNQDKLSNEIRNQINFFSQMTNRQYKDYLRERYTNPTSRPMSLNPLFKSATEADPSKFFESGSRFKESRPQFYNDRNYDGLMKGGEPPITSKFRNEYDDSIFDYKEDTNSNLNEKIEDFKTTWFENYDEESTVPSFRDALDDIYRKEKFTDIEIRLMDDYARRTESVDQYFKQNEGRREPTPVPDSAVFESVKKEFAQFQRDVWEEYIEALEDPRYRSELQEFMTNPNYKEIQKSLLLNEYLKSVEENPDPLLGRHEVHQSSRSPDYKVSLHLPSQPITFDEFAGAVSKEGLSKVFDSYNALFGQKRSKTENLEGIIEFKDRLNHGAFAIPLTSDDVKKIERDSILAAVPMTKEILSTMKDDEFIYAILRK